MIDIDRVMLKPAAIFQPPTEVVGHPDLSREQQIEILRRWAYNARAMEVSEEENMASPYPSGLQPIMKALHALGVESSANSATATMHGGV
jgi:hypothetical protein